MTDLSKTETSEAFVAIKSGQTLSSGLERADLQCGSRGHALHNQLGRRLRTVFVTPETKEDAFDSLLKQISTLLP
jgi:hypothetical protein